MPAKKVQIYQLKITLKGSKPPIWRRALVKSNEALADLHEIIQAYMGWYDCHLHMFRINGENFGVPDPEFDFEEIYDESRFKLSKFNLREKDKFTYEYDFGDGWDHVITVEKILPVDPKQKYPVCIKGKNACPPEDCGGLRGYYDMLKKLADENNPDREELLNWLDAEDFDPLYFNVDDANASLGIEL